MTQPKSLSEIVMREPYYKGDGYHSVHELQKLCNDFKEYCYQKQLRMQALTQALEKAEEVLARVFSKCADVEYRYLREGDVSDAPLVCSESAGILNDSLAEIQKLKDEMR